LKNSVFYLLKKSTTTVEIPRYGLRIERAKTISDLEKYQVFNQRG